MLEYGEMKYTELDSLPHGDREMIKSQIHELDKEERQAEIMYQLAEIAFNKAENYWAEWERYTDEDGYPLYIQNYFIQTDGDVRKITFWNNKYYIQYKEVYNKLRPVQAPEW